jgi:signal transduction histidine kinase
MSADARQREARVATLEQLLEVYERSVIEQSNKLYAEQQRMRLQTTLLESQGEASLDGILSSSVDGRILFANARLAELWGIEAPVIGERSYRATLGAMAERTADPAGFLERAAAAEAAQASREQIALRDGRTFDGYSAPIRSHEEELLGRVWYFRDISAVVEIDRMKNEFISAVSHELRTPLTSIRGSLDLMASGIAGTLPEEALSLTRIAQSNCERLVRLINDVLDIEKIDAGRMELALDRIVLEALVERAVEWMRPYAAELEVTLHFESRAPRALVRADDDRLAQVMDNLLSNAAKFSPAGQSVEVLLERRGPRLRVAVTDHGPGIAPDQHARVFQKFAQLDASAARRREGTGLGLHIARALVERLGGRIGFSSEPGVGSTFYFELPECSA